MARGLDIQEGYALNATANAAMAVAFTGVKLYASDTAKIVQAGAGEAIDGVIMTALASGEQTGIVRTGIVPVAFGGTVAKDDFVSTDAAGKFVKQTAGKYVVGKCIKGGADGEIGSVELCQPYLGRVVARGKAVLVAGTVTVSTTDVLAADIIMLTRQVTGGTVGHLTVGTIVTDTSFVIDCAVNTDTSTVGWVIVR